AGTHRVPGGTRARPAASGHARHQHPHALVTFRRMIRIHNSLTGQKQELRPVEPGHVRMYSCGVTVYDYFHVGNVRMLVVFDMVSRYLRYRGLRVTYVRNITDVDDKIINRARESGVDWREHAKKYIQAMHEDLAKLGCLRPEKEPQASEYIDEMLTMIGQLID